MLKETGICAIVEPREHAALQLVVENMRCTIPSWPIYVFHGNKNEDFAKRVSQHVENTRFINLGVDNLSIPQYNQLCTQVSFYEQFNSEYVLIFQTDSVLFPHSGFSIDSFLGWDYVGAPWSWMPDTPGGNGGLSLRRVQAMIDTCRNSPWKGDWNEDLYFSFQENYRLPPREIANRFSVESVFFPTPFGCHKPWWYLNIEEWLALQEFSPLLKKLCDLNTK
jgi:hypothetical protein